MTINDALNQAIEYLEGHPGEGENHASRLCLIQDLISQHAPIVLSQQLKEGE